MNRRSFASLHRILTVRIALMTILVSAIVATAIYVTHRAGFGASLLDRTKLSATHLRIALINELDSPNLSNRKRIQSILDAFKTFRHRTSAGNFIALRLLDRKYVPVAEVIDETNPSAAAAHDLLVSRSHRFAIGSKKIWYEPADIGGRHYFHLALPLENSRNEVAAYAEGVFAVSETAMAQIRTRAAYAAFTAVLIALVTAALLYPVIIRLMKRITIVSANLLEANLETINVLGSAIAKRDSDTDLHNFRVTIYSACLGEEMGLSKREIRSLIKGAFLHDVGKIGIRDEILLKPGLLDEVEFQEMKLHVQHGRDIVSRAAWLKDTLDVVCWHHEKFDGSGYAQKRGEEIPIAARLFAVVDVFDALTSHRPYKFPLSLKRSMEILEEGRGTHFDPLVLDAFCGIANDLYDRYAVSDRTTLKGSLKHIATRFFTGDIGEILQD